MTRSTMKAGLVLGLVALLVSEVAANNPGNGNPGKPNPGNGNPGNGKPDVTGHVKYNVPNDDEGIPNDGEGGGSSGIGKLKQDILKEQMKLKKMEEFKGHGQKEYEIQAQEAAFEEWSEECKEDEGIPFINKLLKAYMDENNIKMSDMLKQCSELKGQTKTAKNKPVKRSYVRVSAGVWDKCIVPYTFDSSLPLSQQTAVANAHAYFEKYTGFRFKPYDGNNTQWGLTHNNYLNYKKGSGCWSHVGNRNWNGQNISPCSSWDTITHEIGHALGLMHEQHTPSSFEMLSTHFENTEGAWFYERSNLRDVFRQNPFYDMSSIMSYADWMFNVNYGQTITANEAELDFIIGSDNDYYMFEEIQIFHDCFAEYPSCATMPTCEMGGYPSVIDGVCGCRCPPGLDPATNCATRYVPAGPSSWPEGTFTTLKVTGMDCPSGLSTGQMTRWNAYWTWKGGSSHSPGYIDGYEYGHDVCTQTTSSGSTAWPQGEYCFLRSGGSCPSGFSDGKMELFGQEPQRENYSNGALPDGEKGQFFEYIFCCRRDGSRGTPISLPNSEPFILYSTSKNDCQQIEGMQASDVEFYVTKSNGTARNLTFSGELPSNYAWSVEMFNTYYCVYYPVNKDCGEVRTFTDETEYIFVSPGYPTAYPRSTECSWHFKSPEGTKMKIEFLDFEVSTSTDTECQSYVELKNYLPGLKGGIKFCGHTYKKTHETVYNYLTLDFISTPATPWKGFNAKITILKESDKCFVGDGKDSSYGGTVNYAKSFNPCLPWKDVQHCKINQFDPKVQHVDLSNNYCRTVVTGRMPWCYTRAEGCMRENCDACMRDTCYDLFSDCDEQNATDPNFCSKNENGEAARGCMQFCELCGQHVPKPAAGTVNCGAPGDVTEISPTPSASTYNVGDVVTYTCPTSNVERTRTCTSEGTWTHLGYVCSGCPQGWSYISGRCYKWLGWKIENSYKESKATCEALNSTLVILDSQEAVDGVLALTNYDKADNPVMWLGMTVDESRVWTWDDGTAVTFAGWEAYEPDNYRNYEDCAEGSATGTWKDKYCNWSSRKHTVVCTYVPTGSLVCEDDLDNCVDIMSQSPEVCETKPDYAWVNCRVTCNLAECSSTVTCNDAAPVNAQRMHGSDSVNQGQYIEYKCNDGYLETGGNSKRACLPSGQLSGSSLVCAAASETSSYELFTEKEIFRRGRNSDSNYAVVGYGPNGSTSIPFPGNVTAWTFYSNFAGTVTMQVWRGPGNTTREDTKAFTLIGQNTITNTAEDRGTTVQIAVEDQIQAQAGDVVGFHLSEYVISYDRCESNIMPENSYWYRSSSKKTSPNFTIGGPTSFDIVNYDCRIYSIRATVNPSA